MASIATPPKLQFFDANGNPLAGGKLYSYAAGTTTPLATYTDAGGGTANSNPVVMDARGEANVWFGSSQYKLKLTDADNVEIWTVDNLNGADAATLAVLAASSGSSLIGYIQGGSGSVARTVQARLRDFVTVEDYGAVGDGSTDDTAAIQAAINGLTSGQTLVFDRNYKVNGSLTLTSKTRVRLTGKGKVFLSGAASSSYIFQLVGTCDDVEIDHLTLVGDNNSGYTQTAIGCNSGQTISNTRFHDLNISNINVGISHNANLSGSWTGGLCYNNTLDNCLGTVSGSGYGIQMAKATRIKVYGNTINNSGRHSIYQAAGVNCNNIIENNIITNHRSTVGDGSFRCAIVVARSSDVSVLNNKVYAAKDGCMEIAQVTADSANCTNILVEGNTFTNRANAVHTILIGEQAKPGSYTTSYVTICGNTFDDDLSVTAALPPNIYILNGTNLTIENNRFTRRNVTSSLSAGILLGDNTYLNNSLDVQNCSIRNNVATADANTGTNGFVTVCSTVSTGSNNYWVKDNTALNWPKMVLWDATPTNANGRFKFRISLTNNFGSISANTGAVASVSVDGVKPTTQIVGRPAYSVVASGTSYTFYAHDSSNNTVVIQVVNVTTGAIDPADQTFWIDVEDLEPYYG